MNHITRILLLLVLVFAAGCGPGISERDLGFLATQKQPLTYEAVAKHLGQGKMGPGGCFAYHVRGAGKTVEFWTGQVLVSRPPTPSIPAEIAVVVVREEGARPDIIWPEELKGKDVEKTLANLHLQKHNRSQSELYTRMVLVERLENLNKIKGLDQTKSIEDKLLEYFKMNNVVLESPSYATFNETTHALTVHGTMDVLDRIDVLIGKLRQMP